MDVPPECVIVSSVALFAKINVTVQGGVTVVPFPKNQSNNEAKVAG